MFKYVLSYLIRMVGWRNKKGAMPRIFIIHELGFSMLANHHRWFVLHAGFASIAQFSWLLNQQNQWLLGTELCLFQNRAPLNPLANHAYFFITSYYIILHSIISYYIILYDIISYYIILYYIILYYIISHYIILHYIILYYTILYYMVLY